MVFSIPVIASPKLQHFKLHLNSKARTHQKKQYWQESSLIYQFLFKLGMNQVEQTNTVSNFKNLRAKNKLFLPSLGTTWALYFLTPF